MQLKVKVITKLGIIRPLLGVQVGGFCWPQLAVPRIRPRSSDVKQNVSDVWIRAGLFMSLLYVRHLCRNLVVAIM